MDLLVVPLVVLLLLALYRFVGCNQVFGLDETVLDQPPSGLAAFWTLTEGPGTQSGDMASERWDRHPGRYASLNQSPQVAPDSVPFPTTTLGSGQFAAPAGGVTAGVEGIVHRGEATCVRFNGGFVRVLDPNLNIQDALSPAGDFSLVVWVWPESPPPPGDKTYRAVLTCRSDNAAGTAKQGFIIYAGPDDPGAVTPTFTWQAWVGVGASTWRFVIGPAVRFDVPAGLIVTYGQSLRRLRLYHLPLDPDAPIPDTLAPSAERILAPEAYQAARPERPLYIGAGRTDRDEPQEAPNYWFLGLIQEVGVWDIELADDAIAQIFATGAMSR